MAIPTMTSIDEDGKPEEKLEYSNPDAESAQDDENEKKHPEEMDDEEILKEARERFEFCREQLSDIHKAAKLDLRMVLGQQWDSYDQAERNKNHRPCLQHNRLDPIVRQVVNDCVANRPSIKIRPAQNGPGTVPTSEVVQGLIRHICASSDVKGAQDCALRYAVMCGVGFIRIRTDYKSAKSWDQDIIVERIEDPLQVYFPVSLCKTPDWSDAPYCFIRTLVSRADFKAKYGEQAESEAATWQGESTNWTDEKSVFLAEYYNVEEEPAILYQLSTGDSVLRPEDEEFTIDEAGQKLGISIVNQRPSVIRKIMWYLMTEKHIMDRAEVPVSFIPVIPVLGQEIYADGRKSYISLVRHGIDPQKSYNYWLSAETERIALSPKSPWLIEENQIEGYERDWKRANVENVGVLKYHNIPGVPLPTRIPPATVEAAIISAIQESAQDIEFTTGVHRAALGAQSNETSGVAINARIRQSDVATAHFSESLARALRCVGKIILDLIPVIYNVPRSIQILGEDMASSVVLVNEMYHDEKTGEDKLFDLRVGEYEVVVDIGPSYETKRLEAVDGLIRIIQAVPNIGQLTSDILVRNLDIPGAAELAERLKKTIPPQLLATDVGSSSGGINENDIRQIVADLQNVQTHNQILMHDNDQLKQQLMAALQAVKSKENAEQLKMDAVVVRSEAEIHKAKLGVQQEAIKQHSALTQHAVDTAIDLHKSGILQPDYQQYPSGFGNSGIPPVMPPTFQYPQQAPATGPAVTQ